MKKSVPNTKNESFDNYLIRSRQEFASFVGSLKYDNLLRTEVDTFLIAFDNLSLSYNELLEKSEEPRNNTHRNDNEVM